MLSKELLLFEANLSQSHLIYALILINYFLFLLELVFRDLILGFDVYGRQAITFLYLLLFNDALLCCILLEEFLFLLRFNLLLADSMSILICVGVGRSLGLRLFLLLLFFLLGFACGLLTLFLCKFSCFDQALPLSGLLQICLFLRIVLLFFEFLLSSSGCFGAEFL